MAHQITCPQCKATINVIEAFPGSRIFCPACDTCLVLEFEIKSPPQGFVIEKTSSILTPESQSILIKQAIGHLSNWLDISTDEITNALLQLEQGNAYTVWSIPKGKSGVYREISAPSDLLKKIQRRILDRLLYRIPVSNAAHGFVPGRSIVTNARYHLNTALSTLNLDLKDAFPSVLSSRIKHLYVRYLKIPLKHLGEDVPHAALGEAIDMLVKLTTHNGCLPQGGPCSGCLLNVACITLDKNIYRLLKNHGNSYKYTRYADDITISSSQSISPNLQDEINKIIQNCGYNINPKKVRYAERSKGQMLEVTGLILEKAKVRIPSRKLESYRVIIHQATSLSPEEITPEKRIEIQSIIAFVSMVYGKLPHRIWGPYKKYMEKFGLQYPKRATKLYLDLYPKEV